MEKSGIKTILVVEDEPSIKKVCVRVLTIEGFEVDTAENGEIAKSILEQRKYGLILTDIRTPKMTGKELYSWLKEKDPQQAERVIFTTGDTMSGNTQAFLDETARPFLPKPFTPDELRSTIREAIKHIINE